MLWFNAETREKFSSNESALQRTEDHLARGTPLDLRLAAFLIVEYYKGLLNSFGKETHARILPSHDIKKKFLIASIYFPALKPQEKLVERVDDLRNRVAHDDGWTPSREELQGCISSAEGFLHALCTEIDQILQGAHSMRSIGDAITAYDTAWHEALGSHPEEAVAYLRERFSSRTISYRTLSQIPAIQGGAGLTALLTLVREDHVAVEEMQREISAQVEDYFADRRAEQLYDEYKEERAEAEHFSRLKREEEAREEIARARLEEREGR